MGGNLELRRCVTEALISDDTVQISQEIICRAENLKKQHTRLCPVTIHIDECSDNETDSENVAFQPDRLTPGSSLRPGISYISSHLPQQTNHSKWHHGPKLSFSSSAAASSSSSSHHQQHSPNFLEVPETCDLSAVKATAVRLNLRTRTSSFLEWREKWLDRSVAPPQFPEPEAGDSGSEKLTEERKQRIGHALDWLKTELKEMQSMDQHLARQLLSLRQDIHQLRLSRSCQEHRDLLDDVQSDLEEQEELSDVLDLPSNMLNDTPLKHLGVTRMNLSARRFSTC